MKTAVEFYRTELNALVSGRKTEYKTESEIFEKALEMEKEQITNAFGKGIISAISFTSMNGNEYYNETYKSE